MYKTAAAEQNVGQQHSPGPPPTRKRRARSRAGYTFRQKLVIYSALVVALVAAVPLAASLILHLSQNQAQSAIPTINPNDVSSLPNLRDPERREALFIDQMIEHMTLDEEIGQMLVGDVYGTSYGDDLQAMVVNDHIGTVILYGSNIQSTGQTQALDTAIQQHAQIPLFISTDQEGGTVNRLLSITGYRPSAEELGATNDPSRAYQQGVDDGKILGQLGINLNLAPVVDVQTVSDAASILPTRMFGATPEKVITFAGAYLEGLQSQNVVGSIKHWPGLGWSTVDPHDALPVTNRSQADLNAIDFAPYRTLIAQGDADMVMVTHVLATAYDPNMPSSVSPVLVDQVLRHDLGFQGVVVTDGLHMGALSRWTPAQAAVLAVMAGDDMLLSYSSFEIPGVLDAFHQAISSGQITKARIDQSVERILALKIKYGLIKAPASRQP